MYFIMKVRTHKRLYFLGFVILFPLVVSGAESSGELGLLLDTSGSVTVEDFAARNNGLASALRNVWIQQAMDASPRSLAIGVYQFSGPAQVDSSVPWTIVGDSASASSLAGSILSMPRPFAGGADLDSALLITSILAAGNGITSPNTLFLVLGDGATATSGIGRDAALGGDVNQISAWVTGVEADLQGYRDGVIGGEGADAVALAGPEQYEELFGRYLLGFFQNVDNTSLAASAGLGQAVFGGSRATFGDINARLSRLRAGWPSGPTSPLTLRLPVGSASTAEIVPPAVKWSVFGSVGGGQQRGDARRSHVYGMPILSQAGYDLDFATFTAGAEAAVRNNWFIGAALLGYTGDVDLRGVGNGSDQAAGAAIYVSHFQTLAHGFTAYGDVMLGTLSHDVELDRRVTSGIARGDTDASTSLLEMNVGVRREDFGIVHGPAVGLDILWGEMDGFRESGAANAVHEDIEFSSTLMTVGYHSAWRVAAQGLPVIFTAGTAWEHEFADGRVLPSGSQLASIARDAWLVELGARVAFTDAASLAISFENRLAAEVNSWFINLGGQIQF
jgi:hypothetical protein